MIKGREQLLASALASASGPQLHHDGWCSQRTEPAAMGPAGGQPATAAANCRPIAAAVQSAVSAAILLVHCSLSGAKGGAVPAGPGRVGKLGRGITCRASAQTTA